MTLLLVLGLGGCAIVENGARQTETTGGPGFIIETRAETTPEPTQTEATPVADPTEPGISEDGWYDSKDEVALYIHTYGHLPDNYVTKKQAEALGWPGGSLEPYAPGKSIGGSRFGNYEGLLPDAPGRKWTECDIDTAGARSRGSKRIVFSNDGLIYYTSDHYESFELLYGEEQR
ncbi:MAG: ribonuclease [Oscillospiraceae bacterium]|nr:ribonuclease [Oscillospiraceae bacterium]